ncbi:hypothetical protein BU17DRAFT_76137 [Hysterangium stoloniferum]|nr:hypothetical protein BU17DRAFT_76137 [Hysterangium stoloniferum]
MSFLFHPLWRSSLLHSFHNPSKIITRNATSAQKKTDSMDPKLSIIRRALYPPNIKHSATPTGSWRPNTMRALWKAIPDKQAHYTIERAFKLHLRHKRQRREAELERKFDSMRNAMVELARIDLPLAQEANRQVDHRIRTEAEVNMLSTLRGAQKTLAKAKIEGRIRGLFPRELKIPTDTPPREGWNHDWKPPVAHTV